MWARVCRSRAANGSTAPDPNVGLRLRIDPFERHGRVWQWVVDLHPGLPTLTEVLVSCHDCIVETTVTARSVWSKGWIWTQTQPLWNGCV